MAAGGGLEENFRAFARFGDSKSTGKTMTSKNFDKWMKESKVHGKDIKTQDTDIAFNKAIGKKPKGAKTIEFAELDLVLTEIANHAGKEKAKSTGKNEEDISKQVKKDLTTKLKGSKPPALKGTTAPAKAGVVDRLTDTKKYTGAHKERFDDTGKGKGKAGRDEVSGQDGYVSGYKQKDKYGNKA